MQTKESLLKYEEITQAQLQEAYQRAADLTREHVKEFTDKFPESSSKQNFYQPSENVTWTTGFWTGEIWLAYEKTKEEIFKHAGEIQVESFLDRIINKIDVNHHDMGFLYTPSCAAAYQLIGSESGKKAAVLAADNLMQRFQENGQFFQAWGELGASDNYRLIIDCLLNMPLLFFASEVTGDNKYREKAEAHIKTAMNYVIREDHSTYHTYFFDKETGLPIKGVTHQGNRDGSAWARGQAWGIYGAALSYRRLKETSYIDIFRKLSDYFLLHLPKDFVPYWDFDFDTNSTEPRDSSSSAIAACGMLEMANYLEGEEKEYYSSMAKRLIAALVKHCAVKDKRESNGLLLHGTYARSSKFNTCPNIGVDECTIWGDYYYFEALTRLSNNWNSYW